MKAKLLKKIRKRFNWYWSHKGNLVILDKHKQRSYVINETFALEQGYLRDTYKKEDIEVSLEEFFSRIGIDYMSSNFGVNYSMEKKFYRLRRDKAEKLREVGKVHNKKE